MVRECNEVIDESDWVEGRGMESLSVSRRGRSVSMNSGVGGADRGEKRGWERFWMRRV